METLTLTIISDGSPSTLLGRHSKVLLSDSCGPQEIGAVGVAVPSLQSSIPRAGTLGSQSQRATHTAPFVNLHPAKQTQSVVPHANHGVIPKNLEQSSCLTPPQRCCPAHHDLVQPQYRLHHQSDLNVLPTDGKPINGASLVSGKWRPPTHCEQKRHPMPVEKAFANQGTAACNDQSLRGSRYLPAHDSGSCPTNVQQQTLSHTPQQTLSHTAQRAQPSHRSDTGGALHHDQQPPDVALPQYITLVRT